MRYPASEKAEIIQLVEQSHLPAKRTLDKLGIPRATFYRWYDRYRHDGVEALADHRSRPNRVWNRIPDDVTRSDHRPGAGASGAVAASNGCAMLRQNGNGSSKCLDWIRNNSAVSKTPLLPRHGGLAQCGKSLTFRRPNLGRQERNFWMRRQSGQNRRQRQRTPAETIKG